MVISYTLLRVLPQKDREVYNTIKTLPQVKEIIMTYGEYDLICKVESNSLEELDNFIFNKIRTTDGVTATTTLLEAKPKDFSEIS
jgi:DNA-binding Lrp family transcriptional regulator